MSREIGSFEAKTHLAALLDRVEQGESFVITRRGRRSAVLGPLIDSETERIAAVRACGELRESFAARGRAVRVSELVREDREQHE